MGRAAHAGLEPERGVNATVELAHQVLAVAALADPARGTTVTPTALSSGTTSNTVPAAGRSRSTCGCGTSPSRPRVDAAMRSLLPVVPGRGASGERRAEPAAAAGVGARPGCSSGPAGSPRGSGSRPCTAAAVGGASDGNFTAGVGTPTLDGLGAVGGGAHADDEHVLVAELPGRAALLAALIDDLLDGARRIPGGTR